MAHDGTLWRFNNTSAGTAGDPGVDAKWVDFTKTERPEQDSNSSDWIRFMQIGDEGIPIWRDNVTYVATDLVEFGGDIYRAGSPAPSIGDDPSEDATGWIKLGVTTLTEGTSSTTSVTIVATDSVGTTDSVVIGNATELKAGIMTAEDKIQIDDLPDTWLTGTTYNLGDQVSLTRKVYISLSASNVGNNPTSGVTHWIPVGDSSRFLHEDSNWDGNVAYTTNDIITSNGSLFRTVQNSASAYNSATTYSENDVVSFDGTLWRFSNVTPGTAGDPGTDSDWVDFTKTERPENDNNSSDWIKFMQTGDEGVPIWRDNLQYVATNLVEFGGDIYRAGSPAPSIGDDPSEDTANWIDITPTFDSTDSNSGDTLAVNFSDTRGVIKATVDASGIEDIRKYSATGRYSVDDVVWESTNIYRNTTAITADESFTVSKWEELSPGVDTVATPSLNGVGGVNGLMSADDKAALDGFPDAFVNSVGYDPAVQVSFERKIYVSKIPITAPVSPLVLDDPDEDADNWLPIGGFSIASIQKQTTTENGTVAIIDADNLLLELRNSLGFTSKLTVPATDGTAAGIMSVSQRNELVSLPTMWVSTVTYNQGDYVSHNQRIYTALVGGNVDNTPSNAVGSSWRLTSDSGLHLWRSVELYLSGGLVSHAGIIYRANTSVAPGQNAPNTNSNWTILETVANPGSTTTELTSLGVNGTNYSLSSTPVAAPFLLGTGVATDTDVVRTGIEADGSTVNGYVKLTFPLIPAGSGFKATDITFNNDKFFTTGTLVAGGDLQRRIRFVNNNAASEYSSVGFKDNGTDINRFVEFFYPNLNNSPARTTRLTASEIRLSKNATLHNSDTTTGAVWRMTGTVDPTDSEVLILRRESIDLSVTAFSDPSFTGIDPLGISYENIASTTEAKYTPRAGIVYVTGEFAVFQDKFYVCILGYTSAANEDSAPDRNRVNWSELSMNT